MGPHRLQLEDAGSGQEKGNLLGVALVLVYHDSQKIMKAVKFIGPR